MVFQRSSDNGRTWSQPRVIAPIAFKGKSGQDDPQIVVDPVDGRTAWASFMVSYPKAYIAVTNSTDFGETLSSPVEVSPQPPNFDKDELTIKGNTVAVVYKAAGDVRIGWMDKRTGAWNLFFRKSSDGGGQFGSTIRISGFVQGYPCLTQTGYNLP